MDDENKTPNSQENNSKPSVTIFGQPLGELGILAGLGPDLFRAIIPRDISIIPNLTELAGKQIAAVLQAPISIAGTFGNFSIQNPWANMAAISNVQIKVDSGFETLAEKLAQLHAEISANLINATNWIPLFRELDFPSNWSDEIRKDVRLDQMARENAIVLFEVGSDKRINDLVKLNSREERSAYLSNNWQEMALEVEAWIESQEFESELSIPLRESANALSRGHVFASQSLAFSIIEHVGILIFNQRFGEKVLKSEYIDPDEFEIADIGWSYLMSAILRMYEYVPLSGSFDETPSVVNRHWSAHSVSFRNYTQENAITALLNAASWVALYSKGDHPKQFRQARKV